MPHSAQFDGLIYRLADYLPHAGGAVLALLVIFHPF